LLGAFFQIVQAEAGEIRNQDVTRQINVFQVGKVIFGLLESAVKIFAARFVLNQDNAAPQQVDITVVTVGFFNLLNSVEQ
jgi:hypothetical protein